MDNTWNELVRMPIIRGVKLNVYRESATFETQVCEGVLCQGHLGIREADPTLGPPTLADVNHP
jgi:hypothetical protein